MPCLRERKHVLPILSANQINMDGGLPLPLWPMVPLDRRDVPFILGQGGDHRHTGNLRVLPIPTKKKDAITPLPARTYDMHGDHSVGFSVDI